MNEAIKVAFRVLYDEAARLDREAKSATTPQKRAACEKRAREVRRARRAVDDLFGQYSRLSRVDTSMSSDLSRMGRSELVARIQLLEARLRHTRAKVQELNVGLSLDLERDKMSQSEGLAHG